MTTTEINEKISGARVIGENCREDRRRVGRAEGGVGSGAEAGFARRHQLGVGTLHAGANITKLKGTYAKVAIVKDLAIKQVLIKLSLSCC